MSEHRTGPVNTAGAIATTAGAIAMCTLALALGGCGSSSSKSANSKNSASTAPLKLHTPTGAPLATTIRLSSPVVTSNHEIPARYTCDGPDTPLPLTWSNIPPHTAELALFVIAGEVIRGKLQLSYVTWAVTGLSPSSSGVTTGTLPAHTIVGINDEGKAAYTVCPPKGPSWGYAAILYALPKPLGAKPGGLGRTLRVTAAGLASAGGLLTMRYKKR